MGAVHVISSVWLGAILRAVAVARVAAEEERAGAAAGRFHQAASDRLVCYHHGWLGW
jgi:hypothetical protein